MPPPALGDDEALAILLDARYAELPPDAAPRTECVADVVRRMVPHREDDIVPDLHATRGRARRAPRNSIRALVKHLKGISDRDVVDLEVPTGVPWRFVSSDCLRLLEDRQLR